MLLVLLTSLAMSAQTMPRTRVMDDSALKPPNGARVAIVEFADYQCPACAKFNPVLKAAAAKYRIPWVRHDFPLPMHSWSFQAAVYARWFDTKSHDIGEQYRNAIFENQQNIETLSDLHAATQKFALDRKIALPFAVDPQNKLSDAVKADADLAKRMGIHATPTIFIVSASSPAYVQVTDMAQLYSIIDSAVAQTGGTGRGQ